MERCNWPGLINNPLYQEYHDTEWGVESHEDRYLFEMLVLESFHCGLSWYIILKKRESFRLAFDQFDPHIIKEYQESKMNELLNNQDIVRHKGKILATIQNAKSFLEVQKEFGSFDTYIWSFTNHKVIKNKDDQFVTKNELSDRVAKDLKKRGFKFLGSVTVYSYLEAIGVLDNHQKNCFRY